MASQKTNRLTTARSAKTGRFVARNDENRLAAALAYAKVAQKRGRSVPDEIQRVIDRKAS